MAGFFPRTAACVFVLGTAMIGLGGVSAQSEQNGDQSTGKIVTQPARDLGAVKTEIPPLLERASENPYSMRGAASCGQLGASVRELNSVLGPDYSSEPSPEKGSKQGKVAKAGGAAVINSIIPFRGLVREVSGAASAQRRLNTAIDAGFARRGFLRGLYRARGCRTGI